MNRPSLVSALVFWAGCATAQDLPERFYVAEGVEPHVRAAFAAALGRLPEELREPLRGLVLVREPSLGVPGDAPFAYRLLDRAAHAYFEVVPRRVVVTDAGATGRATWGEAGPDPAALEDFLLGPSGVFAGAARGSADELESAWAEFVRRVWSWRSSAPLESVPAPGDPTVFDRFLADGVSRSLGGPVPLEQLLFHELAHAVQLQRGIAGMTRRMGAWASLSGWVDTEDGRPSDGFVGGGNNFEEAVVLVRLLLGLPRGPSTFASSPAAHHVGVYSSYDLREDYAECARLMAYDPGRLASTAPEKFLYLNALGWNVRLDAEHPGPLWIDAERLGSAPWRRRLADGARRLLADRPELPLVDPVAAVAVLRAHAAVLRSDELPAPQALLETPPDLPPPIRARLAAEELQCEVGGVRYPAPPRAVRRAWDQALQRWIDAREFDNGMDLRRAPTAEELRTRDLEDVRGATDPHDRADQCARLLGLARGVLPEAELAAIAAREVRFHRRGGRPLVVARLELLAATSPSDERLEVMATLSRTTPGTFDAVELAATVAGLELGRGRREVARGIAGSVEGTTWGAVRRVEVLLRIEDLDAAAVVAGSCSLPHLRDRLMLQLARAFAARDRVAEARRLAQRIGEPRRRAAALAELGG